MPFWVSGIATSGAREGLVPFASAASRYSDKRVVAVGQGAARVDGAVRILGVDPLRQFRARTATFQEVGEWFRGCVLREVRESDERNDVAVIVERLDIGEHLCVQVSTIPIIGSGIRAGKCQLQIRPRDCRKLPSEYRVLA